MKRISAISLLLILIGLSGACTQKSLTDWPEVRQESKPWTRWWWLGSDVDKAGLTFNLESLARAGIGGVEITPIYGVQGRQDHYIDYLSPQWMEMFQFTQLEAQRLGMVVDMNNGTGWPFGGPGVSLEDAATKAIFQHYTVAAGKSLEEPIVVKDRRQQAFAYLDKLMAYSGDGEKIDLTALVDKEGILNWTAPHGKECHLIALFVGKTLQMVKRAAPGGQGYVLDHFNKEAVMRYLSRFDKAFKDSQTPYPHAFFNDSYEVYGADWTPDFPDQFERRRGYKLQEYFPELLAKGTSDLSKRIITDYRKTIGELLHDNFTKPWTEWAHGNRVMTRNQAHGSPANLIDIYAAVDVPECESFGITDFNIPGLRKDSIRKINDSDATILKYASSAAHITGKPYTSSETFTWLSEHFRTSLSQCKPEIDLMFASGVNHVFFHGTTYSPEEAAWPGWKFYASIDMSHTNPYWRDASHFFDYITRVQSFLQYGRPDNDFLLYLPIYDMWKKEGGNHFTTFAIHGMRERLPEFCDAVDEIMHCGYDLDYISDHYLKTTRVKNNLLITGGGTTYKALIIPAVRYIPSETLRQILELAQQGATVIFVDQYPEDVPGYVDLDRRREIFLALMQKIPLADSFDQVSIMKYGEGNIITGNVYRDLLAGFDDSKESFSTEWGGNLIRRKNADGHHYFLAMLTDNRIDDWISLGVQAESAMFFDPLTGKKGQARLRKQDGKTQVYMQLDPGESLILKTFDKKQKGLENWKYYQATAEVLELNTGWQVSFPESEPVVKECFSLDSLGSWTDLDNDTLKVNMGTARYSIRFDFKKEAGAEYLIDLGDVRESARLVVNGKEAGTLYSVPFRTQIGSLLQDGSNTLELYVTNLPANRISDYDKRGVEWRIFNEINFVSITYQPTKFDIWDVVPSGLLGPVSIRKIELKNNF